MHSSAPGRSINTLNVSIHLVILSSIILPIFARARMSDTGVATQYLHPVIATMFHSIITSNHSCNIPLPTPSSRSRSVSLCSLPTTSNVSSLLKRNNSRIPQPTHDPSNAYVAAITGYILWQQWLGWFVCRHSGWPMGCPWRLATSRFIRQ